MLNKIKSGAVTKQAKGKVTRQFQIAIFFFATVVIDCVRILPTGICGLVERDCRRPCFPSFRSGMNDLSTFINVVMASD
jgi:hypothetical protein